MEWLNISQGEATEIDITGTIGGGFFEDGVTSEQIRDDIQAFSNIDAEKIIVNIESLGGSVQHALAIHDLLAQSKSHIEVRINGLTASAATVIAMAGDKITMSDNALFLIHRVSGFAIGDADDMEAAMKDMAKVEDRLVNIYAKKTGRKESTIRNLMGEDKGNGIWLTAQEAKSKGFIDEIFEPTKMAARVTKEELINFKLPIPIKMSEVTTEEKKSPIELLKAEFKAFKESFTKPEEKEETVDFEAKYNETVESLEATKTELLEAKDTILELQSTIEANNELEAKNAETIEAFEARITELENLSIGEEIEETQEETQEPKSEEDFVTSYRAEQLAKYRKPIKN